MDRKVENEAALGQDKVRSGQVAEEERVGGLIVCCAEEGQDKKC